MLQDNKWIPFLFVAVWLALIGMTACSEPPKSPSPPVKNVEKRDPNILSLQKDSEIVYAFHWSWKGAKWSESDKAYVFTTDLGYQVGLSVGYLGSGSIQLVPCEEKTSSRTKSSLVKWAGLVQDWLLPSAHADHGFEDDSSFTNLNTVEALFAKESWKSPRVKSSGKSYCKIHHLAVPLEKSISKDFKMKDWSSYLKGWYKAPAQDKRVTFEGDINLPFGVLRDLKVAPKGAKPPGDGVKASILLTRYPAKALDSLKLETLDTRTLAYKFLLQVLQTTEATFVSAATP